MLEHCASCVGQRCAPNFRAPMGPQLRAAFSPNVREGALLSQRAYRAGEIRNKRRTFAFTLQQPGKEALNGRGARRTGENTQGKVVEKRSSDSKTSS